MDGDGTYFETIVFEGTPVHVKRLRHGDAPAPYDVVLSADWRSGHPFNQREMERLHIFVREHWDKGERAGSVAGGLNTSLKW